MKKKTSKKIKTKSNTKNQELGQTKNSAKFVLFIFGLGPIIGILIFLYSKGFFDSPNMPKTYMLNFCKKMAYFGYL